MSTPWTPMTRITNTPWGPRSAIISHTVYDNSYAYDVAIAYDGEIDGTPWTSRIIP